MNDALAERRKQSSEKEKSDDGSNDKPREQAHKPRAVDEVKEQVSTDSSIPRNEGHSPEPNSDDSDSVAMQLIWYIMMVLRVLTDVKPVCMFVMKYLWCVSYSCDAVMVFTEMLLYELGQYDSRGWLKAAALQVYRARLDYRANVLTKYDSIEKYVESFNSYVEHFIELIEGLLNTTFVK